MRTIAQTRPIAQIRLDPPPPPIALSGPEIAGGYDAPFWQAICAAGAAIGTAAFYDRLLSILTCLVEANTYGLVRYTDWSCPDIIIPRDVPLDERRSYEGGHYASDPFYRYWKDCRNPGVKTLRDLADAEVWSSAYAEEYLRIAGISDEIAIFLPPVRGASSTLIIDRAAGQFTAQEQQNIQDVFPLLGGLHEAHVNEIMGVDQSRPSAPLRILDRNGLELSANPAWQALFLDPNSGLAHAANEIRHSKISQADLSDGSVLVRSVYAQDFGLAPGGYREEVAVTGTPDHDAPQYRWLACLTRRERDIVLLTLEGHPIAMIAKKLGVTCGTIKNHRLRLYQKLDITTERELFIHHMKCMQLSLMR